MIDNDPEIRYWCEGTELDCCEALGYLVNSAGTALMYVTAGSGKQDYRNAYYRAYITAEPGQSCQVFVTSGKTDSRRAKDAAIVVLTAALLAQEADARRGHALIPAEASA